MSDHGSSRVEHCHPCGADSQLAASWVRTVASRTCAAYTEIKITSARCLRGDRHCSWSLWSLDRATAAGISTGMAISRNRKGSAAFWARSGPVLAARDVKIEDSSVPVAVDPEGGQTA